MKFGAIFTSVMASAVVGFAPVVHAAPSASLATGKTVVVLAPELLSALTSLGVSAGKIEEAKLKGTTATFPVIEGDVDLGTAKGEILHSGGLSLSAGGTTLKISNFIIDTSGDAAVLTGLAKVNESVVGRIPLFSVTLPSLSLPIQPQRGSVSIPHVKLALRAEAAEALNAIFGVTAFQAGIPIGDAITQLKAGSSAPKRVK